jgi:hypothetical protein
MVRIWAHIIIIHLIPQDVFPILPTRYSHYPRYWLNDEYNCYSYLTTLKVLSNIEVLWPPLLCVTDPIGIDAMTNSVMLNICLMCILFYISYYSTDVHSSPLGVLGNRGYSHLFYPQYPSPLPLAHTSIEAHTVFLYSSVWGLKRLYCPP